LAERIFNVFALQIVGGKSGQEVQTLKLALVGLVRMREVRGDHAQKVARAAEKWGGLDGAHARSEQNVTGRPPREHGLRFDILNDKTFA
jgi:hypothetical protein